MRNEGHCHCEAIKYVVEGDPVRRAECHCNACRRLTGTGHNVQSFFKEEQLTVTGEVQNYQSISDSGNTMTRSFCPNCGSRLFSRGTGRPGVVGISMGSFNDASWYKPEVILFNSERYAWDHIDPDIETHDKM